MVDSLRTMAMVANVLATIHTSNLPPLLPVDGFSSSVVSGSSASTSFSLPLEVVDSNEASDPSFSRVGNTRSSGSVRLAGIAIVAIVSNFQQMNLVRLISRNTAKGTREQDIPKRAREICGATQGVVNKSSKGKYNIKTNV